MWYYARSGSSVGPVGDEEMAGLIRDGAVTGATLVWKEGMANWQSAAAAGLLSALPPPPPGVPPLPPVPARPPEAPAGDRSLPVLAHILALLTGFIGPLIVLLATQDAEARAHARRALNWQISLILYLFVSFLLAFVLIGIPLMIALSVCNFIFCIVAAVKAGSGILWDYPMIIRFLKD